MHGTIRKQKSQLTEFMEENATDSSGSSLKQARPSQKSTSSRKEETAELQEGAEQ